MTAMELSRLLGSIDDSCAEEKNTGERRRFVRPLIAAAALLLVFGVIAGFGSGFFGSAAPAPSGMREGYAFMEKSDVPKDAVLPPAQSGYSLDISYLKQYDFASAYGEASGVCVVTVGNWLSENEVCTYYEATVNKCFKGELPETIVIYQLGSSRNPSEIAPFSYGDKLLVFLQERADAEYANMYEIVGADIGCLYAAADTQGSVYFMDLRGLLSLETRQMGDRLPECGEKSAALRNELSLYYGREPLSGLIRQCGDIYSAESVERLFEELRAG